MNAKKMLLASISVLGLGLISIGATTASAQQMGNGSFLIKSSTDHNGKTFEATRGYIGDSDNPEVPEDKASVMSFSFSCPAVKTPSVPGVKGFRGTATWTAGSERESIAIDDDSDLLKTPSFWEDDMADFQHRHAEEISQAIEDGNAAEVLERLVEAEAPISYSVSYEGDFAPIAEPSIPNSSAPPYASYAQCLTGVDRWENTKQTDASLMFLGFGKLQSVVEPPKSITRMESMFRGAYGMKQDISGWDVSQVTAWDGFAGGSGLTSELIPAKFR